MTTLTFTPVTQSMFAPHYG